MDLREVRGKINSVKNITDITAALETFSALKMRKTQKRHNETKIFAETMARIFKRMESSFKNNESIFLEKNESKKILICVVASDRGFCGPFNSNILKFSAKEIQKIKEINKGFDVEIMPIGKKAVSFFGKRNEVIKHKYFGIGDYWEYSQVEDISELLIKSFLEKEYGKVYFFYNRFVSSFAQKPTMAKLFPLNKTVIESFISIEEETSKVEHVLEPNSQKILNETIKEFISYIIYQFILSANTAEHSARMMAMKNASDNASDILVELKLKYNKARQQQITNEVSEISSTKEAME